RMGGVLRKPAGGAVVLALALCIVAVWAAPAGAAGPTTCSGTVDSPGTAVGAISGNLQGGGGCFVDARPVGVDRNLTIQPGAALVAAFGATGSDVTVNGNIDVKNGAAMVLGCNPVSSPCFDDDPANPTLTVTTTVTGNLLSSQALGVIVHNATVGGN